MNRDSRPLVKDLVLVGGGHSHVAVLRRLGMRPLPGVRLTLVSSGVETPYSGMLPGVVAGHYDRDAAHIDLEVLTRFAGARAIFVPAIGLDLSSRSVLFEHRPPVRYDVLSLDVGSTPKDSVPGAAEHAIPVKPIGRFLAHWEALRERIREGALPKRIAVVGGGAGGVEILLAVQYALDQVVRDRARPATRPEYHLFTADDVILPSHIASVRTKFGAVLDARGVAVHVGHPVAEVGPGWLRTAEGTRYDVEEIFWVIDARAAPWLAVSGLAVDVGGFVRVRTTLESVSHPGVFAAGDVAAVEGHALPKSGVYAVREGPVLARNLRRALGGRRLKRYRPQRRALSLISTGDACAVASRGRLALAGRWVWRVKDRIDRRFMRKYQVLPVTKEPEPPFLPAGLADQEAMASLSSLAMRCGGCGAKIGATVLERALGRLGQPGRDDVRVGLDAPDDAAVLDVPPGKALVQSVDFFRAMVDDPHEFGRIAASHALGDIHAMGGEPSTALALVTIPPGPEAMIEDTLTHLMAGAVDVLIADGVALVGGHTGEGAELAMGFAVTGVVDRDAILRKTGLRPGDRLILTKPIGTGTLFAADMRHRAKGRWIEAAVWSMTQSSRAAAGCLREHGARACTDVTGFGLLGHLVEMLRASEVSARLTLAQIPILDGAEQTVRGGILSSLQPQNLRLRRAVALAERWVANPRFALLFDPQTAGGLLAGVPAGQAARCVDALRALGYLRSAVIGTVVEQGQGPEMVRLEN